jgi:hypothetical protein
MLNFNKLAIASGLRCDECKSFSQTYLSEKYLVNSGVIEENKLFETTLLEDFKEHIKDQHSERYKYFLGDLKT